MSQCPKNTISQTLEIHGGHEGSIVLRSIVTYGLDRQGILQEVGVYV